MLGQTRLEHYHWLYTVSIITKYTAGTDKTGALALVVHREYNNKQYCWDRRDMQHYHWLYTVSIIINNNAGTDETAALSLVVHCRYNNKQNCWDRRDCSTITGCTL